MGISSLDIFVTETGSIVGMHGLKVTGLSLRCKETKKKRSIVDDNGIGITGLKMSGLRETSSSLHYDGRPQRRQGSSKGSPTYFCVKSFILLCQRCILFF